MRPAFCLAVQVQGNPLVQSDNEIIRHGADVLADILLDIFLEAEEAATIDNNDLEGVDNE